MNMRYYMKEGYEVMYDIISKIDYFNGKKKIKIEELNGKICEFLPELRTKAIRKIKIYNAIIDRLFRKLEKEMDRQLENNKYNYLKNNYENV